ncbi:MAG TPA: hypothetical protein PKA27_04510 [Fimbriimonadaceae bacterium]|nr:hypothetical protein [Fimbriimonadaceae bacterium]
MRPEWFEAARYRRWGELLDWAKRQPSLELYEFVETVAETIDAKPDRKALKQVLFVLKGKGVGSRDQARQAKTDGQFPQGTRTFITTGTPVGQFVICTLVPGLPHNHLTLWHIHEPWGYIQSSEKLFRKQDTHQAITDLLLGFKDSQRNDIACAEVDPQYAFYRLGQVWANRHKNNVYGHSKAIYNRILNIDRDPVEHPGLLVPSANLSRDACLLACRTLDGIARWIMPFNNDSETISRIHALRWDPELSLRERQILALECFESEIDEFFHDRAYDWYNVRLLDLAYVKYARGHGDEASSVQAIRNDLNRLGPKSAIVQHALEYTAIAKLGTEPDEVEAETLEYRPAA